MLEPASWYPVTFTEMYIPSFIVSGVKSRPIANLLIVVHCSTQKDFVCDICDIYRYMSVHVLDSSPASVSHSRA